MPRRNTRRRRTRQRKRPAKSKSPSQRGGARTPPQPPPPPAEKRRWESWTSIPTGKELLSPTTTLDEKVDSHTAQIDDLLQQISTQETRFQEFQKGHVPIADYRDHLASLTNVLVWLVENVTKNGARPPTEADVEGAAAVGHQLHSPQPPPRARPPPTEADVGDMGKQGAGFEFRFGTEGRDISEIFEVYMEEAGIQHEQGYHSPGGRI